MQLRAAIWVAAGSALGTGEFYDTSFPAHSPSRYARTPPVSVSASSALAASPAGEPRACDDELSTTPLCPPRAGNFRYARTSLTVVSERRILAAATRGGGRRASADDVELALAENEIMRCLKRYLAREIFHALQPSRKETKIVA